MNKSSKNSINIIPKRYIPVDLGAKIYDHVLEDIIEYCTRKGYKIVEKTPLLNNISKEVVFVFEIQEKITIYIYYFGICVISFIDEEYYAKEKYAEEYCEYRKKAHTSILNNNHHLISPVVLEVVKNLKKIVKNRCSQIRETASDTWEYNGMSYVMTVSYIMCEDKTLKEYNQLSDLEKKELQIMLEPSIANKEDTMLLSEEDLTDEKFDAYSFEIEKMPEPKNWIQSKDCNIYISWSAVIVYLNNDSFKYKHMIDALEVDLQSMWLYTYCKYYNLKEYTKKKKMPSSLLKKEKYSFQRKYNEFISNNDTSMPIYIKDIREELIRTSAIDQLKEELIEYIEYCIDETESIETEKHRKYSVVSEILLFIIAFIQIAPMIYSLLTGEYGDIQVIPIIVIVLVGIIGAYFVIRKN